MAHALVIHIYFSIMNFTNCNEYLNKYLHKNADGKCETIHKHSSLNTMAETFVCSLTRLLSSLIFMTAPMEILLHNSLIINI